MELFLVATLAVLSAWTFKIRDQARRIALLARHLGNYQIEKHMETLTQGYLRALGEDDANRREQIWDLLRPTEQAICSQYERFAADFARVGEADARVSTLPAYLPLAVKLLPGATFDMRRALAIHARGLRQAVEGTAHASPRDKAFTVSAELFLMQHTCHWFCKSRAIASARLLARHRTLHATVVASVGPATRTAYLALIGQH